MRFLRWSITLVAASVICPLGAVAELPDGLTTPVSSDANYYALLDEGEDAELEAAPEIPLPDDAQADDKVAQGDKDCGKCDSCGKGGKGCGCGPALCIPGDPISVWDKLTPCHDGPLNIGGWVQAGFYNYNTGMFNNYPNNLNVNQAWFFAEKEADGSCGFDWGFRMDYVYGTDGPDTQAFGNNPDRWDFGWTSGNYYGHAIPQAYVDVAYQDLNVRVGHFYTIIGYEVVTAPDNFFYSHAFTMYYAEPFTHTGALASYAVNDNVEVYGGWTAGFDTGYDKFGGDIFLGGVSVSLTDDVTLIYACTGGKIGFGTDASGYSHSIVLDVALTEKLTYVFQSDFIDYRGALIGVPGSIAIAHRYGVNQYLMYDINDCLAAGIRLEWFNTEQLPGGRSDLYEFTFGLNYKPHPNFIVRPEVRWDRDDDGFTIPAGRNDTVGFGMDVILLF